MPRASREAIRDGGYLTICDLADQTGVSQNTIRAHRVKGIIRAAKITAKEYRIPGVEALRWANLNNFHISDALIIAARNSISIGHAIAKRHSAVIAKFETSLLTGKAPDGFGSESIGVEEVSELKTSGEVIE